MRSSADSPASSYEPTTNAWRLRDAGLLRLIAPVDSGGLLDTLESSVRPLCETYRQLGSADPSVALVSSMHPSVIAFWLASPDAAQPAWEEQRRAVFASAVAVTDRMITTAVPDGEEDPTIFVLDVRDRPWDGTAGLQLIAEWDGMGMAATQSHAMRLDGAPATRFGAAGPLDPVARAAS